MRIKYRQLLTGILLFIVGTLLISCGPKPPIDYQQLQIADSEEAAGYDVYLYVAVKPDKASKENIENLLKWFEEMKYPNVKKMAIFVWTNPQSALMGATGDLAGSLRVDREKGLRELMVN